jgi:hypothetical protein
MAKMGMVPGVGECNGSTERGKGYIGRWSPGFSFGVIQPCSGQDVLLVTSNQLSPEFAVGNRDIRNGVLQDRCVEYVKGNPMTVADQDEWRMSLGMSGYGASWWGDVALDVRPWAC